MRLRREKTPAHRRVVWQAASLLLAYPDDGQSNRLVMVHAAVTSLPEGERAFLGADRRSQRFEVSSPRVMTRVAVIDRNRTCPSMAIRARTGQLLGWSMAAGAELRCAQLPPGRDHRHRIYRGRGRASDIE